MSKSNPQIAPLKEHLKLDEPNKTILTGKSIQYRRHSGLEEIRWVFD
jgi:hypothetical protein